MGETDGAVAGCGRPAGSPSGRRRPAPGSERRRAPGVSSEDAGGVVAGREPSAGSPPGRAAARAGPGWPRRGRFFGESGGAVAGCGRPLPVSPLHRASGAESGVETVRRESLRENPVARWLAAVCRCRCSRSRGQPVARDRRRQRPGRALPAWEAPARLQRVAPRLAVAGCLPPVPGVLPIRVCRLERARSGGSLRGRRWEPPQARRAATRRGPGHGLRRFGGRKPPRAAPESRDRAPPAEIAPARQTALPRAERRRHPGRSVDSHPVAHPAGAAGGGTGASRVSGASGFSGAAWSVGSVWKGCASAAGRLADGGASNAPARTAAPAI